MLFWKSSPVLCRGRRPRRLVCIQTMAPARSGAPPPSSPQSWFYFVGATIGRPQNLALPPHLRGAIYAPQMEDACQNKHPRRSSSERRATGRPRRERSGALLPPLLRARQEVASKCRTAQREAVCASVEEVAQNPSCAITLSKQNEPKCTDLDSFTFNLSFP